MANARLNPKWLYAAFVVKEGVTVGTIIKVGRDGDTVTVSIRGGNFEQRSARQLDLNGQLQKNNATDAKYLSKAGREASNG